MSIVYRLNCDLDRVTAFMPVVPVRGFWDQFDGRSLAATWSPVAVSPADTPEDDAQLADCTILGTVPLLSDKAVSTLAPLWGSHCEVLPVTYPRKHLFILNPLVVVDCLDEARSDLERFPSTGRVMLINRYVFVDRLLEGHSIFRIPQLLRAYVFVTESVPQAVAAAGLTGFSFDLLWKSGR